MIVGILRIKAKIEPGVSIGPNTEIIEPVNLFGCKIGKHCRIGPFVEIQKNTTVGDFVKIGSHTFICANTEIQDNVFIGHGVMFCNDLYPRATVSGHLKTEKDWICGKQVIEYGSTIGSGAIILPGVKIGMYAMIGAGAVVTKDVSDYSLMVGNPARKIKNIS